ncbi:zinc knuckle CX2CX4HX4C containing protein [Tanacetum coccineum]
MMIILRMIGEKGMEAVDVCLDQNGLETGELDEVLEMMNAENEKECNSNNNNDVNNDCEKNLGAKNDHSVKQNVSYAKIMKKYEIPKDLSFIPTLVSNLGTEVVVFDKLLVKNGSERWSLTVYAYFVGAYMHINELRYNIRRIWSKYGVTEINARENGHYMFKFRNEEGMQSVIDKRPWMVKNKPLIVNEWSHELGIQKVEPKTLHVWIKMVNVPFEAWSVDGISALASIELNAENEFKNEIEIQYKDKDNKVKGIKKVQVLYDWKPPIYNHCKVFGHNIKQCKDLIMNVENDEDTRKSDGDKKGIKQNIRAQQRNKWTYVNGFRKQVYKRRQPDDKNDMENKDTNSDARKQWPLKENDKEELRKSSNKYYEETVLEDVLEETSGIAKAMEENVISETRLKSRKLQKACDRVFHGWEWDSNMMYCNKGCRIALDDGIQRKVLKEGSYEKTWRLIKDLPMENLGAFQET